VICQLRENTCAFTRVVMSCSDAAIATTSACVRAVALWTVKPVDQASSKTFRSCFSIEGPLVSVRPRPSDFVFAVESGAEAIGFSCLPSGAGKHFSNSISQSVSAGNL
jgi:hypothetical protein